MCACVRVCDRACVCVCNVGLAGLAFCDYESFAVIVTVVFRLSCFDVGVVYICILHSMPRSICMLAVRALYILLLCNRVHCVLKFTSHKCFQFTVIVHIKSQVFSVHCYSSHQVTSTFNSLL